MKQFEVEGTVIEARQAWAAALRSGKYKQGRGRLRYENKLCCLGVACEVFMQHGGELDVDIYDHGAYTYDTYVAQLPPVVRGWVGIGLPSVHALIALNDTDQASFEEIANYIERLP